MRTVSRRTQVECFKCEEQSMIPVKLEYSRYIHMSGEERRDYAESWLYIHKNSGGCS
ncbi:MAG: DNA-directed RNA polymerase subunit M [Eubacterium sp.]